MPYGIIKIDTITFTDAGVDKSVAISGLVQNPTFTGNVTATGTISGLIVQAPTVTGTTANFASGVYTTQISGAIVKVPAGSAGAPSIQVGVGASVAPGLYGAGTDLLGISTGGAGRIFIDSTGQLGIGTSSPSQALEVAGNISFTANAASARIFGPPLSSDTTLVLRGGSSTGEGANIELGRDEVVYIDATQHLFRSLAGTERARIDNSGRLLVGTSSNRPSRIGTSSFNSLLQIESDTEAAQSITRWAADSNSSRLHLQKGRGTGASPTIVAADDNLGDFTFSGYDGANMTNGARITAAVDGTPGTNDMPGRLVFSTTADGAITPTERLRIDSSGRVGIGTNAPVYSLDVTGRIRGVGSSTALIASNGSGTDQTSISLIREGAATNQKTWELLTGSGGDFRIRTINDDYTASQDAIVVNRGSGFSVDNVQLHANGSERLRIDSSGRLLVGTSTTIGSAGGGVNNLLQIVNGNQAIGQYSANLNGGFLELTKSRNTTAGSHTVVQANDQLGILRFSGSDGSAFIAGSEIRSEVDGTPGTNDMPGRLVFSTTADGASSSTERMRITNDGFVLFGKTSTDINVAGSLINSLGTSAFARDSDIGLFVGRNTNDGGLVVFRQDGTDEGSISVSGTTVSYNGAHLSRWSQLPGGAERTEILRGTVLSNIDEMCGWGEEDNEQLNRMQVSDVEGDPNVSGVFQGWDDDDDTYTDDFYCAMTGDFIIRIAEGITVQRGDLLMSAGDGTAKPQGDDIVRSKTVAKVTSTHVTCTYDDGSYCVPCVLMAC
jgi:hypothetical protein